MSLIPGLNLPPTTKPFGWHCFPPLCDWFAKLCIPPLDLGLLNCILNSYLVFQPMFRTSHLHIRSKYTAVNHRRDPLLHSCGEGVDEAGCPVPTPSPLQCDFLSLDLRPGFRFLIHPTERLTSLQPQMTRPVSEVASTCTDCDLAHVISSSLRVALMNSE